MPPIELSEAARLAMVWDAVGLGSIPTDRLAEAFKRALQDYDDPSQPFGAAQIRNAWAAIQGERQAQRRTYVASDDGPRCAGCDGTGWSQVISYDSENGNKNTAVRPCDCEAGEKAHRAVAAIQTERKRR